jgi:hypothetical protein
MKGYRGDNKQYPTAFTPDSHTAPVSESGDANVIPLTLGMGAVYLFWNDVSL